MMVKTRVHTIIPLRAFARATALRVNRSSPSLRFNKHSWQDLYRRDRFSGPIHASYPMTRAK